MMASRTPISSSMLRAAIRLHSITAQLMDPMSTMLLLSTLPRLKMERLLTLATPATAVASMEIPEVQLNTMIASSSMPSSARG